jgi:hypothetical protein
MLMLFIELDYSPARFTTLFLVVGFFLIVTDVVLVASLVYGLLIAEALLKLLF